MINLKLFVLLISSLKMFTIKGFQGQRSEGNGSDEEIVKGGGLMENRVMILMAFDPHLLVS